jgi:antitoxin (DNA-binding transcriptional repressor) of toxin-antitoxin stability system
VPAFIFCVSCVEKNPLAGKELLALVDDHVLFAESANVDKCATLWYYNIYYRRIYMKFVSVRDFRTSSANIWKTLPEEQEMVITNNGKPIALLTPLSDKTLENTLSAIRQARAINAVKLIQQESLRKGMEKTTMEEIDEEIKRIRKQSKK